MIFICKSKLVQSHLPGAWAFLQIPETKSNDIRFKCKGLEKSWGRLPIWARINEIEWRTALWYDRKLKIYLLPVKKEIRDKLVYDYHSELRVEIRCFEPDV